MTAAEPAGDERRDPRRGLAVGAAGAAAVVAGLSLPWFEATLDDVPDRTTVLELARRSGADLTLTGWEAYDLVDIALVALAALVLGVLVQGVRRRISTAPAVAVGVAALLTIVVRLADPPGIDGAVETRAGAWLALAGAAALTLAHPASGLPLIFARKAGKRPREPA